MCARHHWVHKVMAISDLVRAPQGPADKKAKAWYALPGDEVAAKLGVDLGSGLSAAKAAARLRRDGPERAAGEQPPSALRWEGRVSA
jgi:hypothetical protein